jgi:hypothetical protein
VSIVFGALEQTKANNWKSDQQGAAADSQYVAGGKRTADSFWCKIDVGQRQGLASATYSISFLIIRYTSDLFDRVYFLRMWRDYVRDLVIMTDFTSAVFFHSVILFIIQEVSK